MSRSYHEELGRAVADDAEAFGFFTSILAGLLLGLGIDAWLGTEPVFVVSGILFGAASGYWKLWQMAKRSERREARAD